MGWPTGPTHGQAANTGWSLCAAEPARCGSSHYTKLGRVLPRQPGDQAAFEVLPHFIQGQTRTLPSLVGRQTVSRVTPHSPLLELRLCSYLSRVSTAHVLVFYIEHCAGHGTDAPR
uniref:Uncharacterized protein n=1 Tax=Cacopsylla melanoneura TaxID=428564 RepID=A0A8D9DYQ5_9HEMI